MILIYLLKGDYEDYTWGYHQNHLDYPFRGFQFYLVPLISYLAIAKTFFIFYPRGKSIFKTTIKTKRQIILTNLHNIFSFA